MEKITDISVVPDAYKIFHNSYWINEKGENPEPFVVITLKDLEENKYKPIDNAWKKEDVIGYVKSKAHNFLTLYP